jgi:hypothetical protein
VLAVLVVRLPRHDSWAIAAASITLCVIAISYTLSRSTGIPVLIVQPEHADPLGTVTTGAEIAGVFCRAALMSRNVLTSRKDKK